MSLNSLTPDPYTTSFLVSTGCNLSRSSSQNFDSHDSTWKSSKWGDWTSWPLWASGVRNAGFYHLPVELLAHFGDSRWGRDVARVSSHIPDPQWLWSIREMGASTTSPPPTNTHIHTHTLTHTYHGFASPPVLLTSFSFVFYFTLHKYQVNVHTPGIFLSPLTPNLWH